MSTSERAQPLAGFRIVDLTTNMSGPLATMVLADQGADVIKVEPLSGDVIRSVGTGAAGMSAYFANANNNGLYTTGQVQALNVGLPLLAKNAATGKFKLTVGVQNLFDRPQTETFM